MHNQEISRRLQRLRALVGKVHQACAADVEMRSHWAKYLCVLAAGLIESALEELFSDCAQRAASIHVANYVGVTLSRIQNPKTGRFIDTSRAFKQNWGDSLDAF